MSSNVYGLVEPKLEGNEGGGDLLPLAQHAWRNGEGQGISSCCPDDMQQQKAASLKVISLR